MIRGPVKSSTLAALRGVHGLADAEQGRGAKKHVFSKSKVVFFCCFLVLLGFFVLIFNIKNEKKI